MAERLVLKEIRNKVDGKYVGFTPNGSAVKPVHIASGVLRCIYGEYNTTMGIKRLALVSDAKGVVPKGNELETVYSALEDDEKLEESVSENALESLRNVMQRLLSADKGVYVVKGLRDDMISFTAGSKYFLSNPIRNPCVKTGDINLKFSNLSKVLRQSKKIYVYIKSPVQSYTESGF